MIQAIVAAPASVPARAGRHVHHARGLVLTEHDSTCRSTTPVPTARRSTVFAREVADPDGAGPAVPGVPPGRPRPRGAAADAAPASPGWLDRALADYRVLMLDQRGTGARRPSARCPACSAEEQAEYLTPLPGRLHRPRRRGDPPRARRRALERPRPVLRRILRADLPLERARGPARGVHHRRPAAVGVTPTTSTARPTRGCWSATGATTRATRRTATASARCTSGSRRRTPAAERRPAHGRALPPGRHRSGMSDGAESCTYLLELPVDSPAFRHDVAGRAAVRPQPDLRGAPRGVLRGRRRHALVGASG